MKDLQVNESELIFIDIETAAVVKNLEEHPDLNDAWEYKTRYESELRAKTGVDFDAKEYFDKKAALYPPFCRVVCVTVGRITGNTLNLKSYADYDEKTLLEKFNTDLEKVVKANPKVRFCGLNIVGFDIPTLEKRSLINGVKPCSLLSEGHLKPWEVKSIDIMKIWKGNSFYPDSLASLCAAFGLPSPKVALDGSEVSKAFYENRLDEIVRYCELDVFRTAELFRKMKLEPLFDNVALSVEVEVEQLDIFSRIKESEELTEEMEDEILELASKYDKEVLSRLISAVYLKPKDKVAEKKRKTDKILNLLN